MGSSIEIQIRQACKELEERVRNGERGVAEQLLETHAELAQDSDDALELIYREFVVLEELGECPTPEELLDRFPQRRQELQKLLEVHNTLDEDDLQAFGAVSNPTDPVGTMIGHYKLLQEIGEGGFGVVYLAEQMEPVTRQVAVKIIKPGMDTREVIARFEAERQALAIMDHPNIARVLDGGATEEGRPYFVMELVRGVPITEFCDKNRLPTVDRLQLFQVVCQAVQHAHQKGIIHRDLKPSNVMITLHDGVPVPKVIDFGVAKAINQRLTDKTLFTRYGQMVGTPQYMSPEQAEMSGLDIDTRSDIYSLGVLLYELLTGTEPIQPERLRTAAYAEMVRIIHEEDPPTPSSRVQTRRSDLSVACEHRNTSAVRLANQLKGDLDRIIMKAIEKDRRRRYETASELAADVDRYLNDDPVLATSPSVAYRARKFASRNRALVISTGSIILALSAGFILAVAGLIHARRGQELALSAARGERIQRERAESEEANAKRARNTERQQRMRAETNLYHQQIAQAHREWLSDNLSNVAQILKNCREEYRGWEWHYLYRLCHSSDRTLSGHSTNNIYRIDVSPDGRWLASCNSQWNSSRIGEAIVWNQRTGEQVHVLGSQPGGVRRIKFSPDSHSLAITNRYGGGVSVWNVATGATEFAHTSRNYEGVAFSPSGKWLAAGGIDGKLDLFDAEKRALLRTFSESNSSLFDVDFHPHRDWVAAVSHSGHLNIWDCVTGDLIYRSKSGNRTLDFSPDGKLLATGGYYGRDWGTIHAHEISEDKVTWIAAHVTNFGPVKRLCFTPDNQYLAVGSRDSFVRLWNAVTGQQMARFRSHDRVVNDVAYGPDGREMVTCGNDQTIKSWTLSRNALGPIVRDDNAYASALDFSPTDRYLAISAGFNRNSSGTRSKTVQLWRLSDQSGQRVLEKRLEGFDQWMTSLSFSHNGTRIAAGGEEGGIHIWDVTSEQTIVNIEAHSGAISGIDFSPDDSVLLSAASDGKICLWDTTSGQILTQWNGHKAAINDIQYHPTKDCAVSVDQDGYLKLWHVPSKRELQTDRQGEGDALTKASFNADGSLLAIGDSDGRFHLWSVDQDPESARPTLVRFQTVDGHEGSIVGLSFQPGNKRIASVGKDRTVAVWDMETLNETIRLKPQTQNESVFDVAFSNDGHRLVASCQAEVTIWDASDPQSQNTDSNIVSHAIEWHKERLGACRRSKNWFGVIFHCDRLLAYDPDNKQYMTERDSAHVSLGK